MRRGTMTWAVIAVSAAAGISACGGSSGSPSNNGVAGESPAAILSAADAAVSGLKSAHLTGSIVSGGTPITLSLDIVAGQGASGSMSENGLSFKLIAIAKNIYIDGSPAFWTHFGGAAAASLFKGKWLKAPASGGDFGSLAALTNLHSLFNQLLGTTDKLAAGTPTAINGQKVVAVRDLTKGGTLYVAATGPAYPIEVLEGGGKSGKVTFSNFNESVTVTAPASSINLSQLEKG